MFEQLLPQVANRAAKVRERPWALGVIVVIGAVARVWRLGATSLNFDESYSAMVGRLPVGEVFPFLRGHDSHPPLDYLLQLPLARAGVSPFAFRLPAALFSIGALALFAWWMRDRSRAGIVATAAMAVCSFQLVHGREARMYAPLELIGVGLAVVADAWLRAPRRRLVVTVGALIFVGLMIHISTILVAIGLIALAGRRTDADAWHWRAAIATGTAGWALLWGGSFLVQARGGHSSWIPHTTPVRFVDTIGSLVTGLPGISLLVVAAIVTGIVVCRQRDRPLAMVMVCCFVIPVTLAGLIGLREPVLLDRTLTIVSWAPLAALGYLVDAVSRRTRTLGIVAAAVTAATILSTVPHALDAPGPGLLTQLERVARTGDVVAIQPSAMGVEVAWSLGVRSDDGPARAIQLPGIQHTEALALVGRRPSGRIWLMELRPGQLDLRHFRRCAPTRHYGTAEMLCLRDTFPHGFTHTSTPSIAAIFPDHRPAPPRPHARF